jgi:hypothetical protein
MPMAASRKGSPMSDCRECEETLQPGEAGLCAECRREQADVPYDVSVALQNLNSAIDRAVESRQDRGWDTGPFLEKVVDSLKETVEQWDRL